MGFRPSDGFSLLLRHGWPTGVTKVVVRVLDLDSCHAMRDSPLIDARTSRTLYAIFHTQSAVPGSSSMSVRQLPRTQRNESRSSLMEQFKMRIGSEWRGASDGRTFENLNP
jgi:hypothetical protein